MRIKVISKSKHKLPEYSMQALAGMDLRANLKKDLELKLLERICQMIIAKHEIAEWESVDILIETDRGRDGFVHTGKE